jgi:cephalosporin hydroxylase
MINQMPPPSEFEEDIRGRLVGYAADAELMQMQRDLLHQMNTKKYAYNFTWFGRPIIQIPQDTVTFQEIIWEVKPDLIIETGVAHGGSLVFSASMLALLELFGLVEKPTVVGIDIEIRPHNRLAIEQHPAMKWIQLFEGSSVTIDVVDRVRAIAQQKQRVMVFLDSNHTHAHVLAELQAYAPLVTEGSYCVVADTGIEDVDPSAVAPGREWCRGNSPKSALAEYLRTQDQFVLDCYYHQKAWVTSAPGGYIRRVSASPLTKPS